MPAIACGYPHLGNIFLEFHGLEVFGICENIKGVLNGDDQHFTQTALQAIFRLGSFYAGTRLNKVSDNDGSTVTRTKISGG